MSEGIMAEPGLVDLPQQFAWCTLPCLVPQFLTAKNMTVLSNLLTHLNWHPVIYSCFQELNHSYKGTVSRMYLVQELYSFVLKNVSRPSYYVV